MDGLLSRYAEVEVGSVFHLICVASFFDPVTNRMAVYPVHHVTVVIHTVPVMMWPIAYRHTHQTIISNLHNHLNHLHMDQ